jgi:hypothetical protein
MESDGEPTMLAEPADDIEIAHRRLTRIGFLVTARERLSVTAEQLVGPLRIVVFVKRLAEIVGPGARQSRDFRLEPGLGGSRRLTLVAAGVATYELHTGAAHAHIEDPRVRCVDEIEANNLVPRDPELAYELDVVPTEDELLSAEEYLLDQGYVAPVDVGLTRGTYTITPAGLDWLDSGPPEPPIR